MQTKLIDSIQEAAEILRCGGLVAFPTETVFGLGVDACHERAVERLFAAKGRPSDNPLIVHLSDSCYWPLAASELTHCAAILLEHFAPGPITVVLPKNPQICPAVTGGLSTVGIRIPSARPARDLLRAAGIPVAAPSANLSGRPSGTTWQSVLEDLDGRIDAILTIDVHNVGLESSVVDCTGQIPVLLRPGAVGLTELQKYFADARGLQPDEPLEAALINSPGLRHRHYQPKAKVRLVEAEAKWSDEPSQPPRRFAYAGMENPPNNMIVCQQYTSLAEFAQGFYEFLRAADRAAVDEVLIQLVTPAQAEQSGIAAALRDRQLRAAGLK